MQVYFDYAATYPTLPQIVEKSFAVGGNPSSPHAYGTEARRAAEWARGVLAAEMGARAEEIYFLSGATEANNTAVFGVARARERFSKRIVTDNSQHPSVAEPLRVLEQSGWQVIRVSTLGGKHDEAELKEAFSAPTALAVFMSVNNETGAAYDIKKIRRIIDISGCNAHLHVDGVQGFKKYDTPATYRLCDSVAVSAHKIGGFKGCGALYVKKGSKIKPLIIGGGQEKAFRSGTENVNGMLSFAYACGEFKKEALPAVYQSTLAALKEVPYLEFNLPESRCNHIISCIARGIRSETLINYLSEKGVYCSASSACSSRAKGNSVLEAYGVKGEDIISALRISVSPETAQQEINILKAALISAGERFLK